jgi:hypothetical protein
MSTTNAVKAPSPAAGGPPAAVPDLECVESRLDRIQWLVDRLVKSVDMVEQLDLATKVKAEIQAVKLTLNPDGST